jgi:hypothetical protein
MSATKSEVTINDHPVPERIWIDFLDDPFSGKWRVYTAPNAFAGAEYLHVGLNDPSDAANAAATEICDFCGIDTADSERVAAIISKHFSPSITPADAEQLVRLREMMNKALMRLEENESWWRDLVHRFKDDVFWRTTFDARHEACKREVAALRQALGTQEGESSS